MPINIVNPSDIILRYYRPKTTVENYKDNNLIFTPNYICGIEKTNGNDPIASQFALVCGNKLPSYSPELERNIVNNLIFKYEDNKCTNIKLKKNDRSIFYCFDWNGNWIHPSEINRIDLLKYHTTITTELETVSNEIAHERKIILTPSIRSSILTEEHYKLYFSNDITPPILYIDDDNTRIRIIPASNATFYILYPQTSTSRAIRIIANIDNILIEYNRLNAKISIDDIRTNTIKKYEREIAYARKAIQLTDTVINHLPQIQEIIDKIASNAIYDTRNLL